VHDAGETSPPADHAQTLDRRADLLDVADALVEPLRCPALGASLAASRLDLAGRPARSSSIREAREGGVTPARSVAD